MNNTNKIRALKDRNFRNSLSDSQRAKLGEHPAGAVELNPAALEMVSGGATKRLPGEPAGTHGGVCCES